MQPWSEYSLRPHHSLSGLKRELTLLVNVNTKGTESLYRWSTSRGRSLVRLKRTTCENTFRLQTKCLLLSSSLKEEITNVSRKTDVSLKLLLVIFHSMFHFHLFQLTVPPAFVQRSDAKAWPMVHSNPKRPSRNDAVDLQCCAFAASLKQEKLETEKFPP